MLDTSATRSCEQQHRAARLANHGHHYAAAVVAYTNSEARQAALNTRRQQLEDEQQLQKQAFLRAKAQTHAQLCQETSMRAAGAYDVNTTAMEAVRTTHANKLALYVARENATMERQPVLQSAGTLHLHRAEQRMALQKKYLEAAILQELAQETQNTNTEVVQEERQRQLCGRVNRYAASLDEKERILEEGLRAKQRLTELRGSREVECGNARLAHMESELLSAQARQRLQLDTLGYVPLTSSSQASKARRGVQLEREVDRKTRTTPSLCETYGYLLLEQ